MADIPAATSIQGTTRVTLGALTLREANIIIDAALAAALQKKSNRLTVTVLDAGGHLIALKREDGCGFLRVEIAQAKAWGALGMGHGSRFLAARAEGAPAFFVALSDISHGRIAPVPGGVLVRGADGELIGAVGVSGDLPDRDEECALAGIEAAGLLADPG